MTDAAPTDAPNPGLNPFHDDWAPGPRTVRAGPEVAEIRCPTGVVDLSVIDTTPGADCPMAPPACSHPMPALYREIVWRRFRENRAARQRMAIWARRLAGTQGCPAVVIAGPYAAVAREILEQLGEVARGRP